MWSGTDEWEGDMSEPHKRKKRDSDYKMEQIAGTSCNITKSNSIANKNEQPYVTIN